MLPVAAVSFLVCIGFCIWPERAAAHVKWFADYDLQCPPAPATQIWLGPYFLPFCLFVGPLMFSVAWFDRYLIRNRCQMFQFAQAMTLRLRRWFSTAMRLGVSAFFVAAATYAVASDDAFILTPELSTPNHWIIVVQLAVALLALVPGSVYLAGAGIIALYVYAVANYGAFHLLDYPIFIGVALYLILMSIPDRRHARVAGTQLRLLTGATLLWAAVEKFAYPGWSAALLAKRPELTLGLDIEFFMIAAGFVEFCAAWLLITGQLSSRVAALLLLFFFVAAIYHFGVIDAIGHSVIIVVLALFVLDENPLAEHFMIRGALKTAAMQTGLFFASMILIVGLYCGAHHLSYGPYVECDAHRLDHGSTSNDDSTLA